MKGCLYSIGIIFVIIVFLFLLATLIPDQEMHYYKTLDGKVYTSQRYRSSTQSEQRRMRQNSLTPDTEVSDSQPNRILIQPEQYRTGQNSLTPDSDKTRSIVNPDGAPILSRDEKRFFWATLNVNEIIIAPANEISWAAQFLVDRNMSDSEFQMFMAKIKRYKTFVVNHPDKVNPPVWADGKF